MVNENTATARPEICPLCGGAMSDGDPELLQTLRDANAAFRFDFCPNCGARSNRKDLEWQNKVIRFFGEQTRREGGWR